MDSWIGGWDKGGNVGGHHGHQWHNNHPGSNGQHIGGWRYTNSSGASGGSTHSGSFSERPALAHPEKETLMRHILFFATKEDLLPMLQMAEAREPLKYVRTGNFTKPNLEIFLRGSDIPGLGKATCESAHASASYLVCEQALPVVVRQINRTDGTERFCVDQLHNPDTVGFTPAGMWNDDILLHGRVATASDSEVSQSLMKLFHTAIKKRFTKIRAFYVGPNAQLMLRAGKRLTIAEQSPREFDLAPIP